MQTRMHQLPPRYMQIFYETQKVLQREFLQNFYRKMVQCAKDHHKNNIMHYYTRKLTSFITPAEQQTQPLQTNLAKPPIP